ncbi:hypothetical protein ASE17_07385 [Phenylobacterium sp. Root77]|uniref:TonB-dependent receptor n=1 Tax=unclassified Phenylobacterium TaxID=2640670 RepID=UPI0006F5E9A2|nr:MULTISPECIES: TonB-dependent receptor [unclassified Phenylobacterium]KQW68265.1 hypothetical protein ASC73_17290 [Phenylobacterium sp. Root1277]KQW92007.1 hypothetical protein ASC79_10665 [Phenylobacterium sp. Root1290]KRC40240.1 hypothetical protein ASE17_07385 [Phenylobacterium sp. Root77]
MRSKVLLGGVAAAALSYGSASAQDGGEAMLEELVVTALKRSTTVQDTPMSITAVGAETIAQLGATRLEDYFRQVPSVNLSQGQLGQSRVSIRGVQGSGEATTGLYYDETPLTGPSGTTQDPGNNAADLNLFDVERVEVLRGPQGTLYGGGSMGGTLRVIFNKPDPTQIGGAVEAQRAVTKGGSDSGYLKGMINLPLIDGKLAVRAVAYGEARPGYVDNVRLGRKDINDSESSGYRVLLGFTPTEDVAVTATVVHQVSEADDVQGWYQSLGEHKTDSRAVLPIRNELDLYSLTAKWESPFGTLTGSSSHYKYDILRTVDFSPAYGAASPALARLLPITGYQPANLLSWNNELRLSSRGEGPLQWTIGAYTELRKDHIDSNTLFGDASTGMVYEPFRYVQGRYVETEVQQTAGFGEVSYKPVERLTLTVGARYYDYTKTTSGAGTQRNLLTGAAPERFAAQTADASGWVYRFNASYEPTSDILFYATASEGFRPGGANNIPGLNQALVVYAPDSLWNYEAGVKSTWLEGRMTANLAVYQIDWKDRQTGALTADGLYSFITNAGAARIRGFELELAARPMTGLTLNGAVSYTNAELTEDQANANILSDGSTGRKGDSIPLIPDLSASASATYVWPIAGEMNGLARADVAYTGEMASTFRPTYVYYDRFGSFTTVNLRAGIEGDDWGLYAFVQNLTDAVGIMNKNSGVGYQDLLFGLTPRTVGVNMRKRF